MPHRCRLIQPQALDIQLRVQAIQPRALAIQLRVRAIQSRALAIQPRALAIQPRALAIRPHLMPVIQPFLHHCPVRVTRRPHRSHLQARQVMFLINPQQQQCQ